MNCRFVVRTRKEVEMDIAQCHYVDAEQLYQEALEIYRRVGDSAKQAVILSNLGNIAMDTDDTTGAERYYQVGPF